MRLACHARSEEKRIQPPATSDTFGGDTLLSHPAEAKFSTLYRNQSRMRVMKPPEKSRFRPQFPHAMARTMNELTYF